jgi:hypothetical protein
MSPYTATRLPCDQKNKKYTATRLPWSKKKEEVMTPRKLFSLILILALSALSACGGGDNGDGGGPPAQPVRANVFIAFDQPVTNLAGLDFVLNSGPGATFDNTNQPIAATNAAEGSATLVVGNFNATTNTNRIVWINGSAAGLNTGTTPIVRVTYDVAAGSGVPTFAIASQATFSAIAPDSGPTTPPVSAANVVVTVTYE